MKLRTLGLVAALALVAGNAQAQDAGWDTKYGILFTLPNLLQNGGSDVINDYSGLVGFQYNLSAQNALRLSAFLSRASQGLTKTETAAGTSESVPVWTSNYDVQLAGEYMLRMSTAAVSPYVGVGAFLGFSQDKREGDAKTNGVVTAQYDYTSRSYGIGALGKLGLEWRIHKVISLFAEYQAVLTLVEGSSTNNKITDVKTSEKHFVNLGTGIANFGQLGVAAFF